MPYSNQFDPDSGQSLHEPWPVVQFDVKGVPMQHNLLSREIPSLLPLKVLECVFLDRIAAGHCQNSGPGPAFSMCARCSAVNLHASLVD